jgi:hypothetical protein
VLRWLAAGLALVVVVGAAVGVRKSDVHLTARVEDAAEIGGPRLSAHVDGRDAYLSGRGTESDLAHAMALTAGIPGLRTVRTEVEIVAARTQLEVDPEAVEPSVSVILDNGRITLRGLVADDGSHASILAAAEAAVGTDRVRDRLHQTRAVKSSEWLDDVAPAIAAVAPFPEVTLAFGADRVLVTGSVATAEVKAQVADALRSVGIDAGVESLTVIAPQQPWLNLERTSAGISMAGLIGRDQLQVILSAIDSTYGSVPTSRAELVLAVNSAEVAWPSNVAALLPSTFSLDPWTIRVDGNEISLFGVASDPAAPVRIAVVAERLSGERLVLDLHLTPAAVVLQLERTVSELDWFEGPGVVLTPETVLALDEMVYVLFGNPEVAIRVMGHPAQNEDIATDRENGLLRAATVRSYLVSRGIDPARVDAVGSPNAVDGEETPAAITLVLAGAGSEP